MRTLLVALIVAATALFVLGVAIERGDERSHHAEAGEVVPGAAEQPGTGEDDHAEGAGSETGPAERAEESHPLGIDVEAWPFVVAGALASLVLAIAVWLRPRLVALLTGVGLAMLAFALLDVAELFHQAEIDETGLAVLAGVIAALHLAAAAVAGHMAIQSHDSSAGASEQELLI